MRSLDLQTGEPTEHYLVELLSGYAVSKRIQSLSSPFVELLAQAWSAAGVERVQRLRTLGDAALFVSGFLGDSCERRGITHTYVAAIGARAYGEVGRVARFASPTASAAQRLVFQELADRFEAFSRVLEEVREQTALGTDGEVLRVYERWCTTRSPTLFQRLRRRGVAPELGAFRRAPPD